MTAKHGEVKTITGTGRSVDEATKTCDQSVNEFLKNLDEKYEITGMSHSTTVFGSPDKPNVKHYASTVIHYREVK